MERSRQGDTEDDEMIEKREGQHERKSSIFRTDYIFGSDDHFFISLTESDLM